MKIKTTLAAAVGTALALAAPAFGAALSDPTEAGRYELARDLVLPTPNLTAVSPILGDGDVDRRRGIREGGLSALQVVPGSGNRRFVSISDRGPNGAVADAAGGRSYPSPTFSPIIYELEADDSGRLDVISRKQIYVPAGDPIRQQPQFRGDSRLIGGIRNVVTPGIDDRTYLMTGDRTMSEFLPTDPYGLDSEGIQQDPRDGSYWISDEYRPSILHVARDGQLLARIVPDGAGDLDTDPTAATVPLSDAYGGIGEPQLQELLPQEYNARKMNRGLEGPRALGGRHEAVRDDAELARHRQIPGARLRHRLRPRRRRRQPDAGEPELVPRPADRRARRQRRRRAERQRRVGLPARLAVDHDARDAGVPARQRHRVDGRPCRLIVDEHDDVNPDKNGRKLFEVDLNQATDLMADPRYDSYAERAVARTVGGRTQPLGCYFDNGSRSELEELQIAEAPKSAYLNLGLQRDGGVEFLQGKIEGIAPLQGIDGIAIVNDNDFGFSQAESPSNLFSSAADPSSQLRVYVSRPQVSGGGPVVNGTAKAGRTLTCTPGDFTGRGTLTTAVTWLRNGT